MADEVKLVKEISLPISMKCSTSTAIEKGAVLKETSPLTASLSDGDTDFCAGIAAQEILATNSGFVPVYRDGWFIGTAGVAGVTAGQAIITDSSTSGDNRLVNADVNSEQIVGICHQTATSGNTFLFELKPMSVNLA